MGKLQEIKDQVAMEYGFKDWEEMFRSYRQRNMPMLLAAKFDKVMCLFATAVAEDALKRAAERATMIHHCGHFKTNSPTQYHQIGADNLQVNKQSILSTEINLDL